MAKVLGIGPDIGQKIANAKAMQQEARQRMQRDSAGALDFALAAARKMEEAVELSRKTGDEAQSAR